MDWGRNKEMDRSGGNGTIGSKVGDLGDGFKYHGMGWGLREREESDDSISSRPSRWIIMPSLRYGGHWKRARFGGRG